jgi:type IV pilus assembly protein PilM
MSLSNPLAKRGDSRAEPAAKRPAGGRSLSDYAKMDIGELLGAVRLPSLPSRNPRAPHASRSTGRRLVGVDIEPGFVAVAEVSVNGRIAIERAAGVELAPEVVRDGEVVDVAELAAALKRLFSENKLDPRVRLGIANQRIVVRTVELPPIADARELDLAVRFQAQNELPMSLDSAVIDYQPLGLVETESGPRQRFVLVAARREMVERLIGAAREAGLRPEGIDLSAFALIRALYTPGTNHDEHVVYLSLGGVGNLAVAQGPVCQFTRVLSIGLESIAGDIAERLGISVHDARAMTMRADVANWGEHADTGHQSPSLHETASVDATHALDAGEPGPFVAQGAGDLGGAPGEASSGAIDVVHSLLSEGIRRIGVEIRNSLHYHALHAGEQRPARVVVSGAMTAIPGFVAALANELELDVEAVVVDEARSGALGDVPRERLAVAAGLAVTEVLA